MADNMTHYETITSHINEYRQDARDLIKTLVEVTGHLPVLPIVMQAAQRAFSLARANDRVVMGAMTATMLEFFRHVTLGLPNKYSVMQLLGTKEMAGYIKEVGAISGNESALTTLIQHYQTLAHEFAGKRVYEVTAGLAEKLANTRLRGLTCNDLRLPFESIYIVIPPHANLRLFNMETGWHKAIGVYITEDTEAGDARTLQYLVVGENKSDVPTLVIDDALFHFHLDLTNPSALIDAAIASQQTDLYALFDTYGKKFPEQTNLRTELEEEWRKVYEWTVNVLLYSTWPNADVAHVKMNKDFRQLWDRIESLKTRVPKNNPKLKDMRACIKDMDPRNRVILGRGVTLDSVREEMARNGGAMTVRIRVEGHWQGYWHGPKDGERVKVRQWKEPYWKGPEDAPTPDTTIHELR